MLRLRQCLIVLLTDGKSTRRDAASALAGGLWFAFAPPAAFLAGAVFALLALALTTQERGEGGIA